MMIKYLLAQPCMMTACMSGLHSDDRHRQQLDRGHGQHPGGDVLPVLTEVVWWYFWFASSL